MSGLMPLSLVLLAGMSLFATVVHFEIARKSPKQNIDHLTFSVFAFVSFFLLLFIFSLYLIDDPDQFRKAITFQAILPPLYHIAFLFFARSFNEIHERRVFFVLLTVNIFFLVRGMIFQEHALTESIDGYYLPESSWIGYHMAPVNPVYSIWGGFFLVSVYASFSYVAWCGIKAYLLKKQRITKQFLMGISAYFILFTADVYYFRTHGVHIYLSAYGFAPFILLMSAYLTGSRKTKATMENEDKYRRLIEGVRDDYVVFTYLPKGICTYISPSVKKILGYEQQDFLGKNWSELSIINHDMKRIFSDDFKNRIKKDQNTFEMEVTIKAQDGKSVLFDLVLQLIKNSENKITMIEGFSRDMTKEREAENELLSLNNELEFRVEERTKTLKDTLEELRNEIKNKELLEHQLRQAQKMESIGQLAGGVAHDFNNIMTAICGFTELAINDQRKGLDTQADLEQVLEVAKRGSKLTEQLLGFARKQIAAPQVIKPNEALTKTLKLIPRLIENNITIDVQFRGDAGYIKIDPVQLDQVIINLVVNARDAMDRGGQITIVTQNLNAKDLYRSNRPEISPGKYVSISVIDTGSGIAPENLKRIFEPFYTTKPVGKGSGLGLAVCYGVVKQYGGYIFVDSEPRFGSTFEIVFPEVEPPNLEKIPSKSITALQESMEGGNEKILLVEDDPAVAMLTEKILSSTGYKVLVSSNGVEALDVIESYRGEVDLLITDVMMPKMDGSELINTVRLLSPDLAIVCLSGYADSEMVDNLRRRGVTFLPKPYTPLQLAKVVRSTLARRSQAKSRLQASEISA